MSKVQLIVKKSVVRLLAATKQGLPGPRGISGPPILSGEGPPDAGLGLDGDHYVDLAGAWIYGPKTAGSWGAPYSIAARTPVTVEVAPGETILGVLQNQQVQMAITGRVEVGDTYSLWADGVQHSHVVPADYELGDEFTQGDGSAPDPALWAPQAGVATIEGGALTLQAGAVLNSRWKCKSIDVSIFIPASYLTAGARAAAVALTHGNASFETQIRMQSYSPGDSFYIHYPISAAVETTTSFWRWNIDAQHLILRLVRDGDTGTGAVMWSLNDGASWNVRNLPTECIEASSFAYLRLQATTGELPIDKIVINSIDASEVYGVIDYTGATHADTSNPWDGAGVVQALADSINLDAANGLTAMRLDAKRLAVTTNQVGQYVPYVAQLVKGAGAQELTTVTLTTTALPAVPFSSTPAPGAIPLANEAGVLSGWVDPADIAAAALNARFRAGRWAFRTIDNPSGTITLDVTGADASKPARIHINANGAVTIDDIFDNLAADEEIQVVVSITHVGGPHAIGLAAANIEAPSEWAATAAGETEVVSWARIAGSAYWSIVDQPYLVKVTP